MSFEPTVKYLWATSAVQGRIAGIASLNYSLSKYPDHPISPSPPKDPDQKPDPSRMAVHPDHVVDVLTAIDFLQRKKAFTSDYVLVGHSAGATLAFQAVMKNSRWRQDFTSDAFHPPKVILGLNGLYDQNWSSGVRAILAQSLEDLLVPVSQTQLMLESLTSSHSPQLHIRQAEITGNHDGVWTYGQRLAEILTTIILDFDRWTT